MVHIRVKKGLDVPARGKPEMDLEGYLDSATCALSLEEFEKTKFKLLVEPGEFVKIGQPLALDKEFPERKFVSPASGTLGEPIRGHKRRILYIPIQKGSSSEYCESKTIDPEKASLKELQKFLGERGLLPHIHKRPCNRFADPTDTPKSIFIKAIETAPFAPPPEKELEGFEEDFAFGISVLKRFTDGEIHLVSKPGSLFEEVQNVSHHTFEGPHPAGNASLHIYHIDPIKNGKETVWTLTLHDVICIGMMARMGKYHTSRVISLAGEGLHTDARGFIRCAKGAMIKEALKGKCIEAKSRKISGDLFMGSSVEMNHFIGFSHASICAVTQPKNREFLHFFKFFRSIYSASHTYLRKKRPSYPFTTLKHGEERAFVDGSIYDRVTPMEISTMHLIKAIIAQDFEKAQELGLLEVDAEDFALPAFICPSKIDMTQIVKEGLHSYAEDYL